MKQTILEKTIQNAKLIKYLKKDLFETNKIIVNNFDVSTLADIIPTTSHITDDITEALKDDAVYTTCIAANAKKIELTFKRKDWRGDNDCSIIIGMDYTEMNEKTLEFFYKAITKFVNVNITEIYEAVEKEKKKKAIKKFRKAQVA